MTKQKDFYTLEKNISKLKAKIDTLQESEAPDKEEIKRLREQIAKEWDQAPAQTDCSPGRPGSTASPAPLYAGLYRLSYG